MNKTELLTLHKELTAEAQVIMRAKNQDYTGGTDDPFANFKGSIILGIEPEIGLMNRMLDKFQRVRSFVANGTLAVHTEGVRDIGADLINYSVLLTGLMMDRAKAIVEAGGEPVKAIVSADATQALSDVDKALTSLDNVTALNIVQGKQRKRAGTKGKAKGKGKSKGKGKKGQEVVTDEEW
jgi:hypothetical protein